MPEYCKQEEKEDEEVWSVAAAVQKRKKKKIKQKEDRLIIHPETNYCDKNYIIAADTYGTDRKTTTTTHPQ